MFESVRAFFASMQKDGYRIEIRSFDQIRGTRDDIVGFTIRGACILDRGQIEKQPLMIEFDP